MSGEELNEVRGGYCHLLEVYEEGSVKAFIPWALDELNLHVPRIEAEEALEDLKTAISRAKEGDDLGALIAAVCSV